MAKGLFTIDPNPLISGLAGALLYDKGHATGTHSEKWSVEYRGLIRGHTVYGYVVRDRLEKDTPPRTLLGSLAKSIPVLLVLSDDEKEFEVMEQSREQAMKRYRLLIPTAD